MKVNELLQVLKDCDPDSEVLIDIKVDNEHRLISVGSVEDRQLLWPGGSDSEQKAVPMHNFSERNAELT